MEHHHNYELITETRTGFIEVCRECKKKLTTRKDAKGRINNEAYRKEHIRDFAQPGGNTDKIFQRYYGKDKK